MYDIANTWRSSLTLLLAAILVALGISPKIWAADDGLVVGVFPRRNFSETIRMYTPLARYLSERLGRKVRLESTRDFPSFWESVTERRYDLVHYNQYHYVKSHKLYGYQVIAKNEEGHKTTIAGAIVVRKDSGIKSLKELKGRKIVFGGGRDAMMSFLIPNHLLRQAGLRPGDYVETFAINPPNACMAAYYRQGDAAGIGDVVLSLPIVKQKINTSEMMLLAVSQPVAHLPWAVKHDLGESLKARLASALLGLGDTPEGKNILKKAKLTGLVVATDDEYDPHRRIIRDVTGEMY